MTGVRWYARVEGEGVRLRRTPQLASWNKSTDPDQVRLRAYLDDTAELLDPTLVDGLWALRLDIGFPTTCDLVDKGDLDNYAFPLATHLRTHDMVSMWCTKQDADSSTIVVAALRKWHRQPRPSTCAHGLVRHSGLQEGGARRGSPCHRAPIPNRPAAACLRRRPPAQLAKPLEAHNRRPRPTTRTFATGP